MKKQRLLVFCVGMELLLIVCITLANIKPIPILYFGFYNLMYGLLCSCLIPLYLMHKERKILSSVGIKKLGVRQVIIIIAFVSFSIGGQLIPLIVEGKEIEYHLLPMGIVPLIMTTFFEEFFFRGFVQSRIEEQYGCIPAILISGAMFSLYHLGYPGFRTMSAIVLLFVVGIGFAIAYKLSDNNLFVSYFVNLPNAFVTYILKNKQFPTMYASSTLAAIITLVLIAIIFYFFQMNQKNSTK